MNDYTYEDDQGRREDQWSPLFTSELADQVRETFEELIGFGGSPVAATQETVHRFGALLNDDDNGPVVLVVLAALQLRHKVVFSSIRDAAIAAIDSGAAGRLATDPGSQRRIRELLAEIRDILASIEVEDEDDEEDDDE